MQYLPYTNYRTLADYNICLYRVNTLKGKVYIVTVLVRLNHASNCLADNFMDPGARIAMRDYSGEQHQQWDFEFVGGVQPPAYLVDGYPTGPCYPVGPVGRVGPVGPGGPGGPGGYPGGYPAGGYPGAYPPGGYPPGGYPPGGCPPGGYPRGGYPPGGYPPSR